MNKLASGLAHISNIIAIFVYGLVLKTLKVTR